MAIGQQSHRLQQGWGEGDSFRGTTQKTSEGLDGLHSCGSLTAAWLKRDRQQQHLPRPIHLLNERRSWQDAIRPPLDGSWLQGPEMGVSWLLSHTSLHLPARHHTGANTPLSWTRRPEGTRCWPLWKSYMRWLVGNSLEDTPRQFCS